MASRLDEFVTILRYFDSKKYDRFDHSTPEIDPDVAVRLVSFGYLQGTNASSMVCPNAFEKVTITKLGQKQLKTWEKELKKKWVKRVFISNFERAFWLVLGIILTVFAKQNF